MEKTSRPLLRVVVLVSLQAALLGRVHPAPRQEDGVGSAIAALGYRIVAMPKPSPCWEGYEKETFGLKAKREWAVKSVKPVPGASRTFFRFLIWEETYDDEGKAGERLLKVRETPACAPVEQREFWMAVGFQVGAQAYILSTNAVMFEKEMVLWAVKLEDRLKRPDAAR